LADVGTLKFGFGALLATLLATFRITGLHWATQKRKIKIRLLFACVGRHDFKKSGNPAATVGVHRVHLINIALTAGWLLTFATS